MRKEKVHAVLNLYNDRAFLSACLESVKDNVDSIIVADGAYALYFDQYKHYHPNAQPWTTDGSLEIIKALKDLPPVKIIECPDGKPWLNQCIKRTALIDAVPPGDWFIIIDADNMLIGNVGEGLYEIQTSGCVVGGTPYYNPGLTAASLRTYWHPWIYQKSEGMHYDMTHWFLMDKYDRVIESTYPIFWTERFVYVHFKAFKLRERLQPHEDYMDILGPRGWLEPLKREKNAGNSEKVRP
jgi:hypothetical protein